MDDKLFEKLSFNWSEDSLRLFVSPSALARKLPYYIQEAGDFKTVYPYYTERKNLPSFQIIYTLEGKGELCYRSARYSIGKGDCFLLNCRERHVYYTPECESWHFLWVHFDGIYAQELYQILMKDHFRIWHLENSFRVESMLRRIIASNQKLLPGRDILNSHLVDSLMTEFLLEQYDVGKSLRAVMPPDIDAIVQDIDANFQHDLSLDSLAERHKLSKFYLSRKFKAQLGMTVGAYIQNCRINHAKARLRCTPDSIVRISADSGFHTPSHFINMFKRHEGMTPLVYRKMWLHEQQREGEKRV